MLVVPFSHLPNSISSDGGAFVEDKRPVGLTVNKDAINVAKLPSIQLHLSLLLPCSFHPSARAVPNAFAVDDVDLVRSEHAAHGSVDLDGVGSTAEVVVLQAPTLLILPQTL